MELAAYTLEEYKKDIASNGLSQTWDAILSQMLDDGEIPAEGILSMRNIGELYEIGLAEIDKQAKKELGKYYTPDDVAHVMSAWLEKLDGKNIADVGCGTGKLILAYLDLVGNDTARELIREERIHLYDTDETALKICQHLIAITYDKKNIDKIMIHLGDFLDADTVLPDDCRTISNPPYYKITDIQPTWDDTPVIPDSKELYSAFMDKIISQSSSAVIITPYSFISGKKFLSLRKRMCNGHNGFIVSFDNVPAPIFCGRKQGIFNTNTANSVRAAITVVENDRDYAGGYRLSHLIRFRADERERLLKNDVLDNMIGEDVQCIDGTDKRAFAKVDRDLEELYSVWRKMETAKLASLYDKDGSYKVYTIQTCRYFTVGAEKDLDRTGKIELSFPDKEKADFAYCLLNSTFVYWFWRIYDGGITLPAGLMNDTPIFFSEMNEGEKKALSDIADEMRKVEKDYLVYKMNAGKSQESIKFPEEYRKRINKIFLKHMKCEKYDDALDRVHSNCVFPNAT